MTTQDVKKVVSILKLLQHARSIDKKYNELPAIIANRNMFIGYDVYDGFTFITISYGEYKYQIPLSYQDIYYECFGGEKVCSLIQRAINALVYQVEHKPMENDYEK